MTVKKEKTKPRGRPPGDPDNLRTERIAFRVHPNLVFELNVLARLDGITRSTLIEKMLIRLVNDHHRRTVIDAVGRYVDGPPPPPAGGSHFMARRRETNRVLGRGK
jgi:hypothetical protein